jgi:ribosomal protein S18 acetylase RimI-like enzyme
LLTFRPVNLETDRDFILELHCLGNYEGDQPWFRGDSFPIYRETWLKTPQPAGFLAELESRVKGGSVIAEVCEENGRPVGYYCLSFTDVVGYDLKLAEIEDIAVQLTDQRRGVGTMMLHHAEALARERGADLLRAGVGSPNVASRRLHEKAGFEVIRFTYEKRLTA